MGKIICGFVGIGKSSIKKYRPEIKCYDLDSTHFKKQEGWENIYIDCAIGLSKIYDYVFLTTYYTVLEELNERKLEWFLVFPKRELKDEYYNRLVNRTDDKAFADGFISRWDQHINDALRIKNDNKIILNEGQYLADIIDKIKRTI